MRAFLQAVATFLAPLICLNCKEEIHQGLFCKHCLSAISFIDQSQRCFRCFSAMHANVCNSCRVYPLIFRQAALFEREYVMEMIIEKCQDHSSLLASLFSLRLEELHWPLFDFVDSDNQLRVVAKEMAKRYKKKLFDRKITAPTSKILYLSAGLDGPYFPFSVTTGKIFHLSFFFPTN